LASEVQRLRRLDGQAVDYDNLEARRQEATDQWHKWADEHDRVRADRDRLRAVLAETPENRAAWFDALREFLPEDEPEDQLAAAVGLVAFLRARAGLV
jgi:hypothetical protein